MPCYFEICLSFMFNDYFIDLADENPASLLPGDATWLRPQTLVHTVQHIAKVIGKKSKDSYKKNSQLPAIEAPHPGKMVYI
jgi:hypothetical protein